MKFIEKITLIIYSNIMLILSIILCLLVFGWLDIGIVGEIVKKLYYNRPRIKNNIRSKCFIYTIIY